MTMTRVEATRYVIALAKLHEGFLSSLRDDLKLRMEEEEPLSPARLVFQYAYEHANTALMRYEEISDRIAELEKERASIQGKLVLIDRRFR